MGKTTLTWEYDGLVGEGFKVYRADSPMDPENLPLPIATVEIGDREYTDETVIDDETYYYRIASYIGDTERLSGEIEHIAEKAGDPYWDSVVALLHFDGDLNDETGRVWSSAGAPAFAAGGVADSLAISGAAETPYSVDIDVLNGDFTIEFFVFASSWTTWAATNAGSPPIAFGKMQHNTNTNYWSIGPSALGRLALYAYNNNRPVYLTTTETIPVGVLTHVALMRQGNQILMSVGGNVEVVGSVGVISLGGSTPFTVGRYFNTTRVGLQDELRITKGVARYTENFTPPTEPFPNFGPPKPALPDPHWDKVVSLLHFDGVENGTTFADERGLIWSAVGGAKTNTSLKKWGTAAGDFNGVNSYISTPHSSSLNVGSADYTVEAWVYLRAATAHAIIVAKGNSASLQLPILLSLDGNGTKVQFGVGIGGVWKTAVSNTTLPLNEWVHIAGVRSGGSLLLFQQGVLVGTAAAVGSVMDNTLPLTIGANAPGNSFTNIVVDDFRLTISVARYTENFTPPTEPFPNLDN